MSLIDPDYNWKQAAAQESVDYDAVKKSFMDQAYSMVANKAKILFRDPFRLGFEVVHRNEKATKMTGFFAFRVNSAILYIPVFFVNGEIKPADMIYRGDVKRFVPNTEEWCSWLVRGANSEAGSPISKSRQRQPDAHMDRLAYPQRVKYASEHDVLREVISHCAGDEPIRKLLPFAIDAGGPDTLEKLAALIDNSETAKRFVVENYTTEELTTCNTWMSKQASVDPEAGAIVITTGAELCKSAAERELVFDKGYALTDNRPKSSLSVVEENDGSIVALGAPCMADVMMADGDSRRVMLATRADWTLGCDYHLSTAPDSSFPPSPTSTSPRVECIYDPESEEFTLRLHDKVFGEKSIDDKIPEGMKASEIKVGGFYVPFRPANLECSGPIKVESIDKDGEARVITILDNGGCRQTFTYAADRRSTSNKFIGDDTVFLPVKAKVNYWGNNDEHISGIDSEWTRVPMSEQGVDEWVRTAGGVTESSNVEIRKNDRDAFDIKIDVRNETVKSARDMNYLDAQLTLAELGVSCDDAAKMLDAPRKYRVYAAPAEKRAYVTRVESMRPWVTGYDPELNVKVDTPQRQVLMTHTPQRPQQSSRYGDHYERVPMGQPDDELGLPDDVLMTRSPEELAQLSQQYQLPHIFDHSTMLSLATSTASTVSQIQQYIPDLETGVDRLFRILFLLRYRPADFEEAYGKDELLEMEGELSELASTSGNNLLRMLKRFDNSKTVRQS